MDLIDKEETIKRIDNLLCCIEVMFTSSDLYKVKKINAFEISEETDLALLVSISKKSREKKLDDFNNLIYQFLDFASKRFSAVEKQFIYLHYFLGIGLNELKEGFYDPSYNCTYSITNSFYIEKRIKNKLLYVFSKNIIKYKYRRIKND